MWKQISALSLLIVTGITGLSQAPALAATAIATDNQGTVYRVTHRSLSVARARVLTNCVSEIGGGCNVVMTNRFAGFGAVAHSPSYAGFATGADSQAKANRMALQQCRVRTPRYQICRLKSQFFDSGY